MDQILIFINNWGTIIAGILTASGTIYLFIKKLMKKLKPHLEILENLQKLTHTVDIIYKEFRPNGGSSFSDRLAVLSKDVKENTELTKNIESVQLWRINIDPVPIFHSNEEGEASYVNPAYCSLLKRTKEELLGNGWKNCLIQEKRQEVIDEWKTCVKEKRAFERFIEVEDRDGKEYIVKVTATRTSSGKYLGVWTQINQL